MINVGHFFILVLLDYLSTVPILSFEEKLIQADSLTGFVADKIVDWSYIPLLKSPQLIRITFHAYPWVWTCFSMYAMNALLQKKI